MAGYSGTPLPKKLGIKEGSAVLLIGAPEGFAETLGDLPPGAHTVAGEAEADVIVFFTTERAELASRFVPLSGQLRAHGGLWIGWPKKSSGVPTDLTEDVLRE